LVSLTISINNIAKQTISYDGSFSATSGTSNLLNSNTFEFITLPNNSLRDIYTNQNQGFRLQGHFNLNNISSALITNVIGNASANPYTFKINYTRDTSVSGINTDYISDIYIDNLTVNPQISLDSTLNTVNEVLYNMGVPSVKKFELNIARTYLNINSQYLFIPGNKIIARIGAINTTSATSHKNITINSGDIVGSGIYSFIYNDIETLTNSYYTSINYTESKFSANNFLSWNENAYNLLNTSGITQNVTHVSNHYCDHNSFNTINNGNNITIIDSNKVNLSAIHVYEISNIALLGSDIENLQINHYNNHTIQIQDKTLMYIDGKFQSNGSQSYPVINNFNYSGVTVTNNYNSGNISYDLSGIVTGNNSGYKFIVFKIYKVSSVSESYLFNNSVYNRILFDGAYYLSIRSILLNIFDSNTVDDIFNSNNNDAIGFCTTTLQQGNYFRMANLKKGFNPIGGNWTVNGGVSTAYSNTNTKPYGCKIENTNGDKGIYISPTALNDDLTLYIGLINA